MSDRRELEERLEQFYLGSLSAEEQLRLLDEVQPDPQLSSELRVQGLIDESVRRFGTQPEGMKPLSAVLRERADEQPTPLEDTPEAPRLSRRKIVTYALAASLAWLVVAGQLLWRQERVEVAFRQRPLVEVYEESVASGFQPYWVCDDERLFAATFNIRQGVPLKLAELPDGCRMEGLAYLAGLSLNSTSLLGRVDGEPVIVFVEKAGEFDEIRPNDELEAKGLRLVRTEKYGLVFYEITPSDRVSMVDYIELAGTPAPQEAKDSAEGVRQSTN